MPGVLRRFVQAAVCAVAAAGVIAPTAGASSITPLPVTELTTTGATLNASISTSGFATNWQFQLGTNTDYPVRSPVQTIPAGRTTPVTVSFHFADLQPRTTYHYRVAITVAVPGNYGLFPLWSSDLTFTTPKVGFVTVLDNRVNVHNGIASFGLICVSSLTCSGELVGTGNPRTGPVVCFDRIQTLPAGKGVTIRIRLTRACAHALRKSYGRGFLGTIKWTTTTGQGTLRRHVLFKKT